MTKLSNEDLAGLIRCVSSTLDYGHTGDIRAIVHPLRDHVEPCCHLGRGADMDGSEAGFRLQLEWYAGQLLSMVDEQQWEGINSWINCTEKFTTPNGK